MNEAPHYCDASRVSDVSDGLTRSERITPARVPQRRVGRWGLERPGIKPGASRRVSPPVDIIETPQPRPIPPARRPNKNAVKLP
jgi:hypothetical protein